MRGLVIGALAGGLASGQTAINLRTQTRDVDFTNAVTTRPVKTGAGLPGTCSTGELYFRTDADPGKNLHLCANGTWNAVAAGVSVGGQPVSGGAPTGLAGFYGFDPESQSFRAYTFGSLLAITDTVVNVATESVPQYIASTPTPTSCSRYGLLFFDTGAPNGGKLFYCNGQTYEAAGLAALGDPGANGLVKRTASNTTAAAVAGTDYYAPGTAIASADLPNPTISAGGRVQAKTCSAGQFVQAIGTDSTVSCAATPPAGLADSGANGLVKRTASNTTAAAVAGADYYAPGTAIAPADLPAPAAAARGGVQSKDCSASGGAVQKINTDGTVTCGSAGGGSGSTKVDWQPQSATINLAANTDNVVYDTVVPGGTIGAGGCLMVNWLFSHSTGGGSVTYKVSYGGSTGTLFTSSGLTPFGGVLILCNSPSGTGTQQASAPTYTYGNNAGQVAPLTLTADSTASAHLQLLANPGASSTDRIAPFVWLVQKVN